jgi:hypothetical protein
MPDLALAADPQMQADAELRMEEALGQVVGRLQAQADEQVQRKSLIEDRWLEDLRQYHGQYDPKTHSRLTASQQSQVFVNLTRSKTNAWEARLADMLFPTDDRNWGIAPTPVPEMEEAQDEGQKQQAEAMVAEAKKRAEAMEREIDDQLRESSYNIRCRDAIHDGCVLGTGIMKGPVTSQRPQRKWGKAEDGPMAGTHVLAIVEDPRPEYRRVDPWAFFPDMSARTMDEAQFTFERHLFTAKDMKRLAQLPSFNSDAIRSVLKEASRENLPDYITQLRAITGAGDKANDGRYIVWEYHGPLEREDVETLCNCMGRDDLQDVEVDDLQEVLVQVWFCQGKVIKFSPAFLDSGDSLYSVWNFEKDDAGIFGFGVPYLMRDSQAAINGAWRIMMDNTGLSAGPQIVVNKGAITPADNDYTLRRNKVWFNNDPSMPAQNAFYAFQIDSRQAELANIIALARQFADDETNLPLVAQGESASHQTQTAQGMSILQNAANVVFRRAVKNWDDDLTIPTIRRAYDWNMQFNDNEDIKGDMEVDARGSSVLLVREIQAQNLMAITTNWTVHPVLGQLLKPADAARKTLQAHMLAADEIIKTDQEIEAEARQAQEQGGQPDPEMMKLQVQQQIAEMEAQVKLQVAEIDRETKLMALAEQRNMKMEDLQAKLGIKQQELRSRERTFAAEAALKERHGQGI